MTTTMKKTYIIPDMSVVQTQHGKPIAGSVTSDNGIGYGGVDDGGNIDPDVKANHYSVWDDDWSK